MTCQDILNPNVLDYMWKRFPAVCANKTGYFQQDARTPKLDVVLTLTEWIILLNLTNSGYIVPVNGWR